MNLMSQDNNQPPNCPLLSQQFLVPTAAVQGRIMTGPQQNEATSVIMGVPCARNRSCEWWTGTECAMKAIARALAKGEQS